MYLEFHLLGENDNHTENKVWVPFHSLWQEKNRDLVIRFSEHDALHFFPPRDSDGNYIILDPWNQDKTLRAFRVMVTDSCLTGIGTLVNYAYVLMLQKLWE